MILVEELVEKEATEIQNAILKKIKHSSKQDKDYGVMGIMNITSLFDNYQNIIDEKNIIIKLYYRFDLDKKITKVTIDKNEINIIIYGINKESVLRSMHHEIIHTIDFLKSGLNLLRQKRHYRKILKTSEEGSSQHKDFLLPYLKDPYELNVLINQIAKKYKENRNFRNKFNKISSYKELLELIFADIDVEITPHFVKDENFKKRLLSRLTREKIHPLKAEKSFINKVVNFLI